MVKEEKIVVDQVKGGKGRGARINLIERDRLNAEFRILQ
jgi:hypothetical protein